MNIRKFISNRMILVLTKRDVMPKSIKDEKLLAKISEKMDKLQDLIVVSSENNYNLDELMAMIKKHTMKIPCLTIIISIRQLQVFSKR